MNVRQIELGLLGQRWHDYQRAKKNKLPHTRLLNGRRMSIIEKLT
jgi:hypothetical protein